MSDTTQATTRKLPLPRRGYGFGTFKGVFTPSVLTILGVIMYLRFGWVLGNVGLGLTLVIVTLASSITFFTGLALCSLATNRRVEGGGAYYMISRSFGVDAGAAIGVPLFFAQTLGIAFYVSGFSEAVAGVLPGVDPQIIGSVTLVVLAALALISADIALKTQFIVMAMIAVSLVSFFLGSPVGSETATGPIPEKLPFWPVFAVFFPAVTGIEAGIAMSGDLKNPSRSLPLGTICAVLTGYAIYLAIPIFLSRTVADHAALLTNTLIMRSVAKWGVAILLGVWAASLSSAMGSILGAPRTLQALAKDGVVPRFLGKGFGAGNDPRIATVASFLVALGVIFMGDLNFIAPVLTMFFLTSYGLLNLAAGLEELVGSSSWRPQFRIPSAISLFGAFACFATMFMINAGATFVAAFIAALIYYLMKSRSLNVQWGDIKYGLFMLMARHAIKSMVDRKPDARTWRPNILAFSGSPTARWHLVEFANAMAQGQACLTIASIMPERAWTGDRVASMADSIRTYLSKRGIGALVKLFPSNDLVAGAEALVKAYGFGPITPNTMIMGITEKDENVVGFSGLIGLIYRMHRNLIIVREKEDASTDEDPEGRIDIWLGGDPRNMGFVLTAAYLLKRSEQWHESPLVLKTIVSSEAGVEDAKKRLEAIVSTQRLNAKPRVLVAPASGVFDLIRDSSRDARLVLLGMRAPEAEETPETYVRYYKALLDDTEGMPATAYFMASEQIEFHHMLD